MLKLGKFDHRLKIKFQVNNGFVIKTSFLFSYCLKNRNVIEISANIIILILFWTTRTRNNCQIKYSKWTNDTIFQDPTNFVHL